MKMEKKYEPGGGEGRVFPLDPPLVMVLCIKVSVTDYCIWLISSNKQYRNVNFANFVRFGKNSNATVPM